MLCSKKLVIVAAALGGRKVQDPKGDQASEIPALNPRADRSSTDDVHSLDIYLHGTPVQPVTCYESRVMCRECGVLNDGSINVS